MSHATRPVIGLGELLWDCFPDHRLPGGAPANVAFHAQQLGLSAAVATRVGQDDLGAELCQFLQQQGLSTELVQRDPQHGTGTVTVEPHAAGTQYTFLENSAWDFLQATPEWLDAAASAAAICFGTLAQRGPVSRETIHRCLAAASADCLIVYDVNLRPPFYQREWIERSLRRARIVKLNDDEVRTLAAMFAAPAADDLGFARWLRTAFDLDLVCVTRGARGALAVSPTETCDVRGIAVDVVDTVGAGDAFTAALLRSRLDGWTLERALPFANQVGALVASRRGAMPILTEELAALRRASSAR